MTFSHLAAFSLGLTTGAIVVYLAMCIVFKGLGAVMDVAKEKLAEKEAT